MNQWELLNQTSDTISKNKLTSFVPCHQSRRWSQVALAADIALDSLRAAMTAAPLCCTVCSHNKYTLYNQYWWHSTHHKSTTVTATASCFLTSQPLTWPKAQFPVTSSTVQAYVSHTCPNNGPKPTLQCSVTSTKGTQTRLLFSCNMDQSQMPSHAASDMCPITDANPSQGLLPFGCFLKYEL